MSQLALVNDPDPKIHYENQNGEPIMITTPNITPGQARDMLTGNDINLIVDPSPNGTRLEVAALKARHMGQRTGITVNGRLVAVIVPVSDLDAVHYCENHDGGDE